MLVVDASALFAVVSDSDESESVRSQLALDTDQVAPHLVDAEVLSAIQVHHLRGVLDGTAAWQAVEDLRSWPGERWPHRPLLSRAWELRGNVRGYDALYVSLAESLQAPLLTLDRRLAAAPGPLCSFIVPET